MTWRSAGEIGPWDQVEPEPWEWTAPAPPRSHRRDESDHDEIAVFFRRCRRVHSADFAENFPPRGGVGWLGMTSRRARQQSIIPDAVRVLHPQLGQGCAVRPTRLTTEQNERSVRGLLGTECVDPWGAGTHDFLRRRSIALCESHVGPVADDVDAGLARQPPRLRANGQEIATSFWMHVQDGSSISRHGSEANRPKGTKISSEARLAPIRARRPGAA
jgi:hypothetical protein